MSEFREDIEEQELKNQMTKEAENLGRSFAEKAMEFLKNLAFSTAAFIGGVVKSLVFGTPNPGVGFFDGVNSFIKQDQAARAYEPRKTERSDKDASQPSKNADPEQKGGRQSPNSREADHTKSADSGKNQAMPDIQKPESQDMMVQIEKLNEVLNQVGYVLLAVDGNIALSNIQDGKSYGNAFEVNIDAFKGNATPLDREKLAAAIYKIEQGEKRSGDIPQVEMDRKIMMAHIQTGIIAELAQIKMGRVDSSPDMINGTIHTSMGSLPYSVSIVGGQEPIMRINLDGKPFEIAVEQISSRQNILDIATQICDSYTKEPPVQTFSIQGKGDFHVDVEFTRGSPTFTAAIVTRDGDAVIPKTYKAEESPAKNGSLATLIKDLKSEGWLSQDKDADGTWLSPQAVALTIGAIVNPNMEPIRRPDEPEQFYSIACKDGRFGAGFSSPETPHAAITFEQGKVAIVSNVSNHKIYDITPASANDIAPLVQRRIVDEIQHGLPGQTTALSPLSAPEAAKSIEHHFLAKSQEQELATPEPSIPLDMSSIEKQVMHDIDGFIHNQTIVPDDPNQETRLLDVVDPEQNLTSGEFVRMDPEHPGNVIFEVPFDLSDMSP